MPIAFTCPNCGRTGRLPENFNKDRVKCPACQAVSPVTIPDPVPTTSAPQPGPNSGDAPAAAAASASGSPNGVGWMNAVPQGTLVALIGGGVAVLAVLVGVAVGVVYWLGRGNGPERDPGPGQPLVAARQAGNIAQPIAPMGMMPGPFPMPPPPMFNPAAPGVPPSFPVVPQGFTGMPPGYPGVPPGFAGMPPGHPGAAPADPALAPGNGQPTVTALPKPPRTGPDASPGKTDNGPAPDRAVAATAPAAPKPAPADAKAKAAPTDAPPAAGPADLVQQIKDATVLIKAQSGLSSGTGSGFVIRVDGKTVYVATNHHVVNPHLEGPEEDTSPRSSRIRPSLTVVFRSGQGPALERRANAEVVASEREGNRDLAILKVERVENPPTPIVLAGEGEADPVETMPVLIYGFPFGNIDKILNRTAQGNPAITINRGSVSSLRRDDEGKVSYVQIDGSLNPGNSGGPVVDEKGRLVGIAVAAISNTTIGFAIPPVELRRMLDGRLGPLKIALAGEQQGAADLQIQARVIDPLKRIKSIELLYLRDAAPDFSANPNADGSWPPLAGANQVGLAINGMFASAPLRTSVNGPNGRRMLVQVAYQDQDGKTIYMHPIEYQIPPRPSGLTAVGVPGSQAPGKNEHTLASLGELIDPAKNCKLARDESSLTIEVPDGVHLFSPELDLKNAPMVVTEVEGDFVAEVKVAGGMQPGTEPARYKGKTLPYTFQGAGLVLWQDKNNYIRLDRVVRTSKQATVMLSSEILLEVCKNGKPAGRFQMPVPDGALYLRITRVDGVPQCMFGPNGKQWLPFKKLAIPFPDKLSVGLSASNASKENLLARFEDFLLVAGGDAAKKEKP